MKIRFGLIAIATFLATLSVAVMPNWTEPFSHSQLLAQTSVERKAEGDRLRKQGFQQLDTRQFDAALQSFQSALKIYREIQDRQSEGKALGSLGIAYRILGDYAKAIEYQQQWLAIAREIKDRKSEGKALINLGGAYYSLGDYAKAIEYAQQNLALTREIKDRQGEGEALGNLGIAYSNLGDYAKTIEYTQQGLAIAREIKDRQSEGVALGSLGNAYSSLGDYAKAIEYSQQSLAIARELKDRNSQVVALGKLGLAYLNLNDYAKVIDYAQQSLAISREIKDRLSEGKALGTLGGAYYFLGDYAKTIEYFQQHLAIAREIKDRKSEGWALYTLGAAYYFLGDYAKAIEYVQQSLTIAREIKDLQSEGKALGTLGHTYLNLDDYAKAIEYAQQWLAIAREIKDRNSEGKALGYLGMAYDSLGDYAKAIEYQQQRLALARELKDRQSEGSALGNLGIAYLYLGDYAKGIEYFQQHLAIAREIKNRNSEGAALGNLGNAYSNLGDYAKAIEFQQQSLAIAREFKDRKSEGRALGNLGVDYSKLGDLTRAIEFQQQSLAIARQIKDRRREGVALGELGIAYGNLGDYAQAIEYSQQWLAIAREIKDRNSEGKALGNLGLVYFSLGDYAKIIKYQEQQLAIAREIKDRQSEGAALNNLGIALFKKGDLAKAEKTLLKGIDVLESLRQRLDDANKISIFEEQARTYRTLQQVFIAQHKANAALEISERGRARALVELLASRFSVSSTADSSMTAPTIAQIQQIAKAQNSTLVQYSIIADDFKVQGKQQSRESDLYIWVVKPTGEVTFRKADLKPLWQQQKPSLSTLASTNRSMTRGFGNELTMEVHPGAIALLIINGISISAIAFWVKQRFFTAKNVQISQMKYSWLIPLSLVVLAAGGSGGIIFWMTTSQPIAHNPDFQADSSLAELVVSTREAIETNERGLGLVVKGAKQNQGARLQQLHQILIQPIADLLPTDANAKVIFIPQSALFLVPFPALQDAEGKYLIEKHTILTAPSIQVLDLTRKQQERLKAIYKSPLQGKDALILGNPTMPSVPPKFGEPPQQLPSLPGAEEEANAIATLLKTQAITGAKATKKAVVQKMRSARIIHLATHGLLDDIRGLGSAIALAPDSSPASQQQIGAIDGLLTAEEILDLKLNAELVVLSACDTGRGKITGDGVVGLSRSLISAGVPSVLVSLWSVPDAPTAELMTEFYRNWQRHPDKARALRQAMLTTMKQHPNPSDWAAFTLIGESD